MRPTATPVHGRTLLKAALAAGVASTGLPTVAASAQAQDAVRVKKLGTIGLVPLDDRPSTWYDPQQIATGAGYDTVLPPRDTLGRHFVPGDGRAKGRWLTQSAHRADALLVALPMLAYGGLLKSRNSSVPEDEVRTRLQAVREVRHRQPHRRLYAFDTIMRLTPESPWRTQLRIWATLKDEVENLGMTEKLRKLQASRRRSPPKCVRTTSPPAPAITG